MSLVVGWHFEHLTGGEFSDEVCSSGFPDIYLDPCAHAAPLVEFVAKTLGLQW